jgi:uncharacterized protein
MGFFCFFSVWGKMNRIVQDKLKELVDLCKNRRVRRLALFGSATTGSFDRSSSDLDLIVEFNPAMRQF